MNRREFVAAGISAIALSPLSAKEAPMQPIIDTHQHLWDLTKVKLSWLKEGSPLNNQFRPQEYATATADVGIVKSVYMEVDVVPDNQQIEADYIIDLCKSKKTPTVAAVLGGHPSSEGFAKYVAQFKGSPYVKGIRQVIHVDSTPAGYCNSKDFEKGVQLLGELGLSFDICIRPGEIPYGAKLVDACPHTRFILDHCGNAPINDAAQMATWKKDIADIASRKNIVCKVSGIVASAKKGAWNADTLAPAINHTIEAFGWDRVMFGGDWPVCTLAASYKEWVAALKSIVSNQSKENQMKLFHDNAAKFYGLT
ncbi:amidohydrolase family protein [Telmatocola sphagniphila]|uniref:Amidohydrolase family protein n=1 Tax=Telmatocola sphagniphila TaxID=1123043 RepID=A0A8E6B8C9_9BACT|nr:amidohydrolase family protein [Telmatocola sphagniphila]QVL33006.1 amidohydrolase family protein [Telmatocola sphagniphila]